MGKSQLARAVAKALGRVLRRHTVDAKTETRDLLYTIDHVARLAEAQVQGALSPKPDELRKQLHMSRFVTPGPLWWAFNWGEAQKHIDEHECGEDATVCEEGCKLDNGCVVLIDEIDKADATVPNGLLEALGQGWFSVPDVGLVKKSSEHRTLVIITTNEERVLPDAFLRRCMVLHLDWPEDEKVQSFLQSRGRAHFPNESIDVLNLAVEMLVTERAHAKKSNLPPPGVAEYIDLLNVAFTMREGDIDGQKALLEAVKPYALNKNRVRKGRGAG